MPPRRPSAGRVLPVLWFAWLVAAGTAGAQPAPPFGQAGKDVEWVPTPDVLVDTMLEMADVTGSCLCGSVAFRIIGPMEKPLKWHCIN